MTGPDQVRHLAGKLPAPEDGDGRRRLAGLVQDLDLARRDDEELEVAVATAMSFSPSRKRLSVAPPQRPSAAR